MNEEKFSGPLTGYVIIKPKVEILSGSAVRTQYFPATAGIGSLVRELRSKAAQCGQRNKQAEVL